MVPEHAVGLLHGPLPDPRAAAARAAEAAKPFRCEVQLVRPEAVVSERHVASAVLHARRAHAERRGRADSLALEFLCYLTGRRQIAQALAVGGLPANATAAVAVALGAQPREALAAVARSLDVRLAHDVRWQGPAALDLLGAASSTAAVDARALELVAMLDVER